MKKTIPTIALLFIIGVSSVKASGGGNEFGDSKKSEPVVHNILSDRLPSRLLTSIKKDYKDYWITNLYKTSSNGKTSYCITVENADQKIVMNAAGSSNWAVTQVITKE